MALVERVDACRMEKVVGDGSPTSELYSSLLDS